MGTDKMKTIPEYKISRGKKYLKVMNLVLSLLIVGQGSPVPMLPQVVGMVSEIVQDITGKNHLLGLSQWLNSQQTFAAAADLSDQTPPSPITNLTGTAGATIKLGTPTKVELETVLNWTNPADTDINEIRVYVSTDTNEFPSNVPAAQLVTLAPGTVEYYHRQPGGLTENSTYYYAIYNYDFNGNYSSATVVLVYLTPQNRKYVQTSTKLNIAIDKDDYAPDRVTDLMGEPGIEANQAGAISLKWTAPTEDGTMGGGQVFSYLVKYSNRSISDYGGSVSLWWNDAETLTATEPHLQLSTVKHIDKSHRNKWGVYAKSKPGEVEKFVVVTGLEPGKYYYFCIRAIDERYNIADYDESARSVINQVKTFATTRPGAPSKLTDLVATPGSLENSVQLSWVAQPDWQIVEGKYRIRYSTTPPVQATDKEGNPIYDDKIWQPGEYSTVIISTSGVNAGTTQYYTFANLGFDTTYYFFFWTKNEWGESVVSNCALSYPKLAKAPDPITALNIEVNASTNPVKGSYVKLSWTNPDMKYIGIRICGAENLTAYTTTYTENIIKTLPKDTTYYEHLQLTPRTTYYYSVFTYSSQYQSIPSTGLAWTYLDYIPPQPITQLFAQAPITGIKEKGPYVHLTWTNPGDKDFVGTRISVSTSTYPTDPSLGMLVDVTGAPGKSSQYEHTKLTVRTTYYYTLFAYDEGMDMRKTKPAPNYALGITTFTFTVNDPYPPEPISALTSLVGYTEETGMWMELNWTMPKSDDDIQGVRICVRTDKYPDSELDAVLTILKPATDYYRHEKLTPYVTYYYAIYNFDGQPNFSSATYVMAYMDLDKFVPPDFDAPDTPAGLEVRMEDNNKNLILTWKPVTRSINKHTGKLVWFKNINKPSVRELYRYEIYRSDKLNGTYILIASLERDTTSYTDLVDGKVYFYKLRARDYNGNFSRDSAVVEGSIEGNKYATIPGDESYLKLGREIRALFSRETNPLLDEDYLVNLDRLVDQEPDRTLKSLRIQVTKSSNYEEVRTAKLSAMLDSAGGMELTMVYDVSPAGKVMRKSMSLGINNDEADTQLAVFWFDGARWIRQLATVDTTTNSVKIRVYRTGTYQLRLAPAPTEFTFVAAKPKVITPNSDGLNDVVFFEFENPWERVYNIKIYDMNNAEVKEVNRYVMFKGGVQVPVWDGTDKNGQFVPVGVYIYQISVPDSTGKKNFSGTIVVAR